MGMCGWLVVKVCAAVIPARRLLSLLPPDEKCRSLEKGFGLNEQGLARALQRRRDCSSGGYFLQRPLPPPPPPPPSLPPRYKAEVNRSCHSPEFSSRADLCSRVFPFSHQTADTHTHTHTDCSSDLQPVFLIPSRRVFTFLFLQLSVSFWTRLDFTHFFTFLGPPALSALDAPCRHGAFVPVVSPAVCFSADGELH